MSYSMLNGITTSAYNFGPDMSWQFNRVPYTLQALLSQALLSQALEVVLACPVCLVAGH